jgi:uncharacterized protein
MPIIAQTAYDMISGMTPEATLGVYVFISTNNPKLVTRLSPKAICTFKEKEGLSMLIPVELAEKSKLCVDHPMRCITLNVYSSLEGVGLTAAVSTALGERDIPCNIIAACHHDHVFVPSDMCDRAMEVLKSLQTSARNSV